MPVVSDLSQRCAWRGEASRVQLEEIERIDRIRGLDTELFRLARGGGRLRLRIGQALAQMGEGFRELGFSTLGGYALERCSRKGRWAAESRVLAERLEELPCLREALEQAEIGWSMAELLARHATVETEAQLLEEARTKTVRAMRVRLSKERVRTTGVSENAADQDAADQDGRPADNGKRNERDEGDNRDEGDAEEERRRTLTLSLPVEDAWMLEAVRMLVGHIDGGAGAHDWLEMLLAEGYVSLMDGAPLGEEILPQDVVAQHEAWLARVEEAERLRREAEVRAEKRLPSHAQQAADAANDSVPDEDTLPTDLHALDASIRQWSAALSSRDLWFGKLVDRVLALQGWRELGYASETQYARERLGMSRAAMRGKLALARNTYALEGTVDALQSGAIGYETAALVARVASVDTEAAWLELAQGRTFKHLREEVQAAEWVARLVPSTATNAAGVRELVPLTDEEFAYVQARERDILSGTLLRRAVRDAQGLEVLDDGEDNPSDAKSSNSEARLDGGALDDSREEDAVQMSVNTNTERGAGRDHGAFTTLRIRVPEEVALHFRQLEEAYRRRMPNGSFTRFLCMAFFVTWAPTLGKSDKWEAIYRRDLYRCTNPVCDRHSVTPHHVRYRSAGGGDEQENLTSPCECCHLEGEHGGRLKIRGRAPQLTWTLGRKPIMKIEGRQRTLLC